MKNVGIFFLCMVGTSALWSMDEQERSDHPQLKRTTSFLRKFFEKRNKKNQKSIKAIQANKTNPAKKIVAENETLEDKFGWLNSTMRNSTTFSPEIAEMLQEQADKLKKQKSPFFHRKKQSDEDSDEE